MNFSDPVANMLSVIRNANIKKNRNVKFPHSSFKEMICKKMKDLGFISEYWIDNGKKDNNNNKKVIKAKIGYFNSKSRVNTLKKISKPSKNIYIRYKDIFNSCKKFGTYFISTSFGLLTQKEAIDKRVGGKIIFFIN